MEYVAKSKIKGRKKIAESFSHVDRAVAQLDRQKKGQSMRLHKNITKVLDDLYSEYVAKKTTEPLTSLEKELYFEIEKKSSETYNDSDKFLVFEVRKESERIFDAEAGNQEYNSKVKGELKNFVNTFTQGFFIEQQPNPEEFQQYYLDHIAQFKTCFYLLMTEAIKN